ncbi:MAG: S8 family serine peptidase, partial [Candidatus Poseidoniaceae archaeon]|nr:S8 family serine peptidase [Candidatus Poseidoniaceae archaeon]
MGLGVRSCVVLLLMLLSTCVAPALSAQSVDETEEQAEVGWQRMSPSEMVSVDLKESTGSLHTTLGSFDPVLASSPDSLVTSHASDSVFIIQLHSADAMILASLADKYSLKILDHLPDEGWVIRTSYADGMNLLEQEPEVRWVGQLQSAWKLSESLHQQFLQPPASIDIAVVLTPDLKQSSEMQISAEFSALGAERTWCGSGQCELWGLSWDSEYIEALATDDRILHLSTLNPSQTLNSHAAETIGYDEAAIMANGLDGTGEVIGIADTGIDSSHPDFGQSILSIKTNYGLDSSALDTNGGHGTHVVGTVIGSGTGDVEAIGLASGALLHFQALEHDNSGYFGRQGSLYDLLRDFYVAGARTGSNSWGAPGAQGQYTSDARSVDAFVDDHDDFTVLFAAGESTSGIASPSTAKNVLSIGASTSNRTGSLPAGSVWSSSATGFSADGRIKPDLVAPGVDICSTMSEDALNPIGVPCASGTHTNGEALYGQSNGSSHSTAVAAASVLLTREFLRNEAMVNAPSADLVRA